MPCTTTSGLMMLGCCGTPPADDAWHIQGIARLGGWSELTNIWTVGAYGYVDDRDQPGRLPTRQASGSTWLRYREMVIDSLTRTSLAVEAVHMRATLRYEIGASAPTERRVWKREGGSEWLTIDDDPVVAAWDAQDIPSQHWAYNSFKPVKEASITATLASYALEFDFGPPDGVVEISRVSVELKDPYYVDLEMRNAVDSFNSLEDWRHVTYGGKLQGPEYILTREGWIENKDYAGVEQVYSMVPYGNGMSCEVACAAKNPHNVLIGPVSGGVHATWGGPTYAMLQRCKRSFRTPSLVCVVNKPGGTRQDYDRLAVSSELVFPAVLPLLLPGETVSDWMAYYPAVPGTAYGSPPDTPAPPTCNLAP